MLFVIQVLSGVILGVFLEMEASLPFLSSLQIAEEISKENPNDSATLHYYSQALDQVNDKNESESILMRVAIDYFKKERYEEAFETVLKIDIQHNDQAYRLAVSLLKEIDEKELFSFFKRFPPLTPLQKWVYVLELINHERWDDAFVALDGDEDLSALGFLRCLAEIRLVAPTLIEPGELFSAAIRTDSLSNFIKDCPEPLQRQKALFLLAWSMEICANPEEAVQAYSQVAINDIDHEISSQALFQAARIYSELGQRERSQICLEEICRKYPNSRVRPTASFRKYSLTEYLEGSQKEKEYLSSWLDQYPTHREAIVAHLLKGLDAMRVSWKIEGCCTGQKDLSKALSHFKRAIDLHNALVSSSKTDYDHLLYDHKYYLLMAQRAAFEAAKCCREIAMVGQGVKQSLHYRYAEEFLRTLIVADLSLKHEAQLMLIDLSLDQGDLQTAKQRISDVDIDSTPSIYLSELFYKKGLCAEMEGYLPEATDSIRCALSKGKGKLSEDKELEMKMALADLNDRLDRDEEALSLFSEVINESLISHRRIEAMFKRAVLYEKIGKRDLARKQLQAIVDRGGEWAERAKTRLERNE